VAGCVSAAAADRPVRSRLVIRLCMVALCCCVALRDASPEATAVCAGAVLPAEEACALEKVKLGEN